MSTCKFISSRGRQCPKKAVNGSDYCSQHKYVLKHNNISNETDSLNNVQETPTLVYMDRSELVSAFRECSKNDTSSSPAASSSYLIMILPLIMKIIMKYITPYINNAAKISTTVPPSDTTPDRSSNEAEIQRVPTEPTENDIIPIIGTDEDK